MIRKLPAFLCVLFLTLNSMFAQDCSKKDFELSDFTELCSSEDIDKKMREIAKDLDAEYKGEDLTVLMILKRAVCLAADLIISLDTPASLECIRCSSYGQNGMSSRDLTITGLEKLSLEGKHVLFVDDIVDTGKTLASVTKELEKQNPASIKKLVLLAKKRERLFDPEYSLFEIPDLFVIGYGLDYKEKYRGLPGIYMLKKAL